MSDTSSVDITRMSLMVRWKPVLFPFEQWHFYRLLPEEGYVVTDEIRERRPSIGSKVEVTGIIGRKGETALLIDSSKPGMQLDGTDPNILLEELNNLENLIKTQLGTDSAKLSRFYEFDVQAYVSASSSPISVVRKIHENNPLIAELDDALGLEQSTMYSWKVSSSKGLPSDLEWYEYFIEPSNRSPDDNYFTYLIFRHPERERVVQMAGQLPDIILRAISRIESQV